MKKTILIIAIALVIAGIIVGIAHCSKSDDKISAETWVVNQADRIDTLKKYAENLDEVYTLYIIGDMSSYDFSNELKILQSQFNACYLEYKEHLSEQGTKDMDAIYEDMQHLLFDSVTESQTPKTPEEISYVKIAYQEDLLMNITDYLAVYTMIVHEE